MMFNYSNRRIIKHHVPEFRRFCLLRQAVRFVRDGMPERKKSLLFLPAGGGLPGMTDEQANRLERETPGCRWLRTEKSDEFLRELPDAEIAVVWRFKREWLERAGNLRLVATPAAGMEWVEIRSRPGLEVVFGTFHGELMGETVVGMMLAFARGIKASADLLAAGETWPRNRVAASMRPLRGSRATILGFGHIGKWIGRLLSPFGVAIRGVNRSDMARPDYFASGDSVHPLADLDGLLPRTDHLILALPGTTGSDNLVDGRRLALLPRTARVYNVGRGNAIDQAALVRALESGAIAGAGLDVFSVEPVPDDDPVRRAPNLIFLPHVSAFAPDYLTVYLNELLPKIRAMCPA